MKSLADNFLFTGSSPNKMIFGEDFFMKLFLALLFSVLALLPAFAGGPKKIAKIDRSLWPYLLNKPEEFDFASKAEMLVFTSALQSYEGLPEDTIRKRLGLERISVASIERWKRLTTTILLKNFAVLPAALPHDFLPRQKMESWHDVVNASQEFQKKIPQELAAWLLNAREFYAYYLYEQLRLAALFPRTTSEILTLDDSEITGFEYNDKQFLLSFDDGPSAKNGTTDKLLTTLETNHMHAIFFVLGDMLSARLKTTTAEKIGALYKPMVIASHGGVHKPHPKYDHWQESLSTTKKLIDSVTEDQSNRLYFRPPYGQRNEKIVAFANQHGMRIMLWNIDSQDWNAKITAKEVADRVITLMLLWRRGIILFHDTHPKANEALPSIWKNLAKCDIRWVDPANAN